jgi:hypothetical protein
MKDVSYYKNSLGTTLQTTLYKIFELEIGDFKIQLLYIFQSTGLYVDVLVQTVLYFL